MNRRGSRFVIAGALVPQNFAVVSDRSDVNRSVVVEMPDLAAAAAVDGLGCADHRVLASSAMALTRRMAVAISSANCRRRSAISG